MDHDYSTSVRVRAQERVERGRNNKMHFFFIRDMDVSPPFCPYTILGFCDY